MKFQFTKIAAGLALAVIATGAQAVAVNSMTLGDTINADGKSGAFRFSPISTTTYLGASLFGPSNGGVIDVSAAGAPLDWTTGFIYAGSPFQPYNTGAISADITDGVLTVSSLPFAGYYVGADFVFNMTPTSVTVYDLVETSANNYNYRLGFNHMITETDDPSYTYVGMTAYWILEGTMTTVPEASTYGMMLAGLGLVGAAVRRRRNMM